MAFHVKYYARCANPITVAYAQYFCLRSFNPSYPLFNPSYPLYSRRIAVDFDIGDGQIRFVDQIEQNHFGQLVGTHEGMLLFF